MTSLKGVRMHASRADKEQEPDIWQARHEGKDIKRDCKHSCNGQLFVLASKGVTISCLFDGYNYRSGSFSNHALHIFIFFLGLSKERPISEKRVRSYPALFLSTTNLPSTNTGASIPQLHFFLGVILR